MLVQDQSEHVEWLSGQFEVAFSQSFKWNFRGLRVILKLWNWIFNNCQLIFRLLTLYRVHGENMSKQKPILVLPIITYQLHTDINTVCWLHWSTWYTSLFYFVVISAWSTVVSSKNANCFRQHATLYCPHQNYALYSILSRRGVSYLKITKRLRLSAKHQYLFLRRMRKISIFSLRTQYSLELMRQVGWASFITRFTCI